MSSSRWTPHAGDWVEIRPAAEIVRTLDPAGDLEGMPFMPEMLAYAGRRFQISAMAHKTCDTVTKTGGRAVKDAVHLADLRCDGSAHGGCQAECRFYWKLAWLRPVSDLNRDTTGNAPSDDLSMLERSRLEAQTVKAVGNGVPVYRCQATTLPEWSRAQRWWDARQYWRDVRGGNATWGQVLSTLVLAGIFKMRRLPVGYRFNCWLYDTTHRILRGAPDPHFQGAILKGQPTPDVRLDLNPGEVVEVLGRDEINLTINPINRNRGMAIDEEMTVYCGKRFEVTSRVTQIINEQTGEMMHFKNPCIVLKDVNCLAQYADRRLLCPRRMRLYWREAWLKRVAEEAK